MVESDGLANERVAKIENAHHVVSHIGGCIRIYEISSSELRNSVSSKVHMLSTGSECISFTTRKCIGFIVWQQEGGVV